MAFQKTPRPTEQASRGYVPPHPTAPSFASPRSLPPAGSPLNARAKAPSARPFWIGLGLSMGWIGAVLAAVAKAGPSQAVAGVPLAEWALGVSAAVSPVAMVWMITAYMQRASDIKTIADPLRRQLSLITGESGAADARIRRFNQAIREQIELLRTTQNVSQDDLEQVMDRVRQHRGELERFENVSGQQVKEIQDVVRRSMMQIEQMMDDKFTMLRVLDGKLTQNSDGVARQVEGMRDQMARMLEEVEQTAHQMADALDRAQKDSRRLADTSRLQESSLTGAAEAAAETLGGLSSRIDLSVAQFLERASSAREEAERLAHALDAQTRALDDFSGTLPIRVSEAESVLRGVADRLYASEQLAREQAVNLSDKLSSQVDGLQSFMDRFTARLSDIDGGLDQRHTDLRDLADRIATTTTGFVSGWEKSLNDLNERTGASLKRFGAVNDETRRNADAIVSSLNETTVKYEDSVVKLRAMSTDSGQQIRGMTETIATQLQQFDQLSKASARAGEEVQTRAQTAMQNLQHVLERVLTAREATHAVGETLVKDIYGAIDQNEKMIARLSEAAQIGSRTVSAAAEQLGRTQSDIAGKARASESVLVEALQKLQAQAEGTGKGLREQTASLMNLLAETQGSLSITDQKLQSFASQAVAPVQKAVQQIDDSADQGLRTLAHYGDGIGQQVTRLQDFHARVGGLTAEMTRANLESADRFESLAARFEASRTAQDDIARQTLAQFTDLSEQLLREIGSLDGTAARAVETLTQSAIRVGEQSYQMLQNAENSGARIRETAQTLQTEAARIDATLKQQNESIEAELAGAERRFSHIGEAIRDRADSAHALIDRVAAHYESVARQSNGEMEAHARRIEQATTTAQDKVDYLSSSLARQADQIESGAVRIETHAMEIAAGSDRATQDLQRLAAQMATSSDAAQTHARQTLAQLDDSTQSFERRTRELSESASAAIEAVSKAGSAFGEQSARLADSGQQIDAVLRQLTGATESLASRTNEIGREMERRNESLLQRIGESVAQMDAHGGRLAQIAAQAVTGADAAAGRYATLSDDATRRIGATAQELQTTAERTEATLAALGINITQQAASLAVVGDQISSQQKMLADAGELQRVQMTDLFERLNTAHKQASEVAERSITYLGASLHDIQNQLGSISDRAQEAVGNVSQASTGMGEQAGLLIQNAQAAEQQARAVLAVTSALQEQARYLGQSLQGESERAEQTLGSLLARLTAGGLEVRELGSSAGQAIASLQDALGVQTAGLSASIREIDTRQGGLTAALDAQRDAIGAMLNRLTLAQDEAVATAERTSSRLNEGAEVILLRAAEIDERAQTAMVTVHAAAIGFAQESEAFEERARAAGQQAQALYAASAALNEKIGALRDGMQDDSDRTAQSMGNLIDLVTRQTGELRDMSAATEMSLTTLGHKVGEQSGALSGVMDQVSVRQREVVQAFESQREAMHGMLNRLTLAQDDIATAGERAAARIGGEAETIRQHMDGIAAQGVQTVGTLQAVEHRLRDALQAGMGMQDQAATLRDSLSGDVARMVERLGAVVAEIDNVNTRFQTGSAAAADNLDRSQRQFAEASAAGTAALQGQADRLQEAGTKVRDHLRLVGEVGDKAEVQARQLADTAEFATTRLVALRESVSAGDHAGRAALDAASQRAEAVKAAMQAEIERLTSLSTDTVARVGAAGNELSAQNEALRANLAASEAALGTAADLMRAQSGDLPALLGRGSGEIEAVTRSLKGFADEADRALTGTADRFISVTAAARGSLLDEMTRVGAVAGDADKVLRHFAKLLAEQAASIKDNASSLSDMQNGVAAAANANMSAIEAAATRLAALRDDAAATASRLTGEIDTLERRASAVGSALTQTGTLMTGQIEAIGTAAAAAEGRIDGAAQNFRDQLSTIGGGMQAQIDEINRGLMLLTAQLDRTGASLRATTESTVSDVEHIATRFDQTGGEAAAQMDARSRQMRDAADQVERLVGGFVTHLEQMIARMAAAGEGIRAQEGPVATQLATMLGHLGAVAERLDGARTLSGTVSREAIERLDEVVTAVQTQMTQMTGSAQTAAGVMRGINQIYGEQSQTLARGVGEAHGQVTAMNKSFGEMQERADRMRTALKGQGDELMMSLRQILVQLEMTGDGLTEAVDRTLAQQAQAGLDKMG